MKRRLAISHRRHLAGVLSLDLAMALGLLSAAVIPFAYTYIQQQGLARQAHHRAVAMELVDGEAEILSAGALEDFPEGEVSYPVAGAAAAHLPKGRFVLRRMGQHGSLEWRPEQVAASGVVRREFRLKRRGGVL